MTDAFLSPTQAARTPVPSTDQPRFPRWLWVWSVVALLALAALARPSDPVREERILHSDSQPHSDTHPLWLRIRRGLLLAHLGLQPIYPWILVGPYFFWLGSRFPLQRGRLPTALPIQLAATLAALGASATYRHLVAARRPLVLVWQVVETRKSEPRGSNDLTSAQTSFVRRVEIATHASGVPPLTTGLVSNLLSHTPPIGSLGPAETGARARHEADVRVITLQPENRGTNPASPSSIATNPQSPNAVDRKLRHAAQINPLPDIVGAAPASSVLLDLLACGALLGASHALCFYRQSRERERRAAALETHLTRARLETLQAQLQPHFLFNTLNSVTALLREDPRAAEEMLVSLSDLLRLALAQSSRTEIPLREEIRFLELYLEIQQVRFGPRLRFETDLTAESLDHPVPALLLQPLVENALRHGLEPSPDPVLVRIVARHDPDSLVLRVEDNGVGPQTPGDSKPKEGTGLTNVRARLAAAFATRASIDYPRSEGTHGFVVELRLPRFAQHRHDAPPAA